MTRIFRITILLCITSAYARVTPKIEQPCNPGKESWGYVEVRPGANMFYWLICSNNNNSDSLMIWLQGGPGASATGVGNFGEVGPQNEDQKPRPNTWINDVNILFVDSPVGTGYSYVNDSKLLTTNNTQIANDLVALLKGFYSKISGFESSPVYIFGESYGGKMAAAFSLALQKEIEKKKIKCSLAGVILGDSWIKPVHSVMSWGPYLYMMSMLDTEALGRINSLAKQTEAAVNANQMKNATILFERTQELVKNETNDVDFYNVLRKAGDTMSSKKKSPLKSGQIFETFVKQSQSKKLEDLMNKEIKEKLNIPVNVTWGGQSKMVFQALMNDFMTSADDLVEAMLNRTKVPIVVYNGQLDLICSTPSVEKWVNEMRWPGTKLWIKAPRVPFQAKDNSTIWFEKSFKNLQFYWIMRAGHMVPIDQLEVSGQLIRKIIGIKKKKN